jgi:hydroxymethylbilane synthase
MAKDKLIKIGTRASNLAIAQANLILQSLKENNKSINIELVRIQTLGDKLQGTNKAGLGDKRDWILELENAIINGNVDMAVHSGKDVPVDINSVTTLMPVLKREIPIDALVLNKAYSSKCPPLSKLETLGTSSIRRAAQLKRLIKDVQIVEHRGNVQTRINKLQNDPNLSGIVLASAGLARLGLEDLIAYRFSSYEIMPAVHQGTLVVQFRKDRDDILALVNDLVDLDTLNVWLAERSCIQLLEADCNSCVGVFGELVNKELNISCRVLSHDGVEMIELSTRGDCSNAIELGESLGRDILNNGGSDLL